ncbi:MAG: O-antigen ligase family protein [Eubacteriales bacterium]|nr:O-antigen ligase family protein [Eubacteriales bacterium]
MSKKSKVKINMREVFTDIISKLVGVYVFLMLCVFPLFAIDKYYNILEEKYYFFYIVTAATAGLVAVVGLIGLLGGAFKKKKDSNDEEKRENLLKKLWNALTVTDRFIILFIIAAALSTCFSAWPYEAMWGNMGRLQGLFFYILAVTAYFLISRFFKPTETMVYLFLTSGALVALWGISDYLGMDIFGWRADANDYHAMLNFTSSIGNVNSFTAVIAIYFGAALAMAVGSEKPYYAYLLLFIYSIALITGISDNAVLGIGGVCAVLPFVLFDNLKLTGKYVIGIGVFALSLAFTGTLPLWYDRTPIQPGTGLLRSFAYDYYKYFFVMAFILFLIGAAFIYADTRKPGRRVKLLKPAWGVLCALVIIAVILAFVDANSGEHEELWKPYAQIFVFSDKWGSNRGYAWKKAFEFFKDFSFAKMLIGTGPETYAIAMIENYYQEMLDKMRVVFDSPHSEPIQYLFTTGILGFTGYYGAVVSSCIRGLKGSYVVRAFAAGLIGVTFTSVINISVPIVTPLVIIMMAVAATTVNIEKKTD